MQTLSVKNSTEIQNGRLYSTAKLRIKTLEGNISGKKEKKIYEDEGEIKEEGMEYDIQRCYNGTEEHPEFSRNHVMKKKKERSIKEDLKKAGFPPEIIVKADEVYAQLNMGSKRGIKKKQVMFFCAQTAYNAMNIPEDPSHIAEKCGITRADISKANSLCAPSKTNFKAPLVNFGPNDYIETFYQKLINLGMLIHNDAFLKLMHEICNEALAKDTTLKEEKPHTMAAAVILYYLNINNLTIEKSKFTDLFGFSEMTLVKIRNKIERAYSS